VQAQAHVLMEMSENKVGTATALVSRGAGEAAGLGSVLRHGEVIRRFRGARRSVVGIGGSICYNLPSGHCCRSLHVLPAT
jgi:hypothetical protein